MQQYGNAPQGQYGGSQGQYGGGYGGTNANTYNSPSAPQGQWGAPQNQSWGQQNNAQAAPPPAPVYNPGTYGPMPGAQAPPLPPALPPRHSYIASSAVAPPPPPPPVPGMAGFGQQPSQTGYSAPPIPQPYNSSAPTHSQTSTNSYFPSQPGSSPSSPAPFNSAGTVFSPTPQQPAYVPPSLSGQGVAAYMPSNTNPQPGVYVPPPPDIPAWTQAQHPSQNAGPKKFKFTRPSAQGTGQSGAGQYGASQFSGQSGAGQSGASQHSGQSGAGQYGASQYPSPSPFSGQPGEGQYGSLKFPAAQHQQQQQQYGNNAPAQMGYEQQQQYNQNQQMQQQPQHQQQNSFSGQYTQPQQAQPYQHQSPPPPPTWDSNQAGGQQYSSNNNTNNQQQPSPQHQENQSWQLQHSPSPSMHQTQGSTTNPQTQLHNHRQDSGSIISPIQDPVSPISHRESINIGRNNSVAGSMDRKDSLSRKAVGSGRQSPSVATNQAMSKMLSAGSNANASALGTGGPSDWEHFGSGADVDDTARFGAKSTERPSSPQYPDAAELPDLPPTPPPAKQPPKPAATQDNEWPTPPAPPPLNVQKPSSGFVQSVPPAREQFSPTPPPAQGRLTQQHNSSVVSLEEAMYGKPSRPASVGAGHKSPQSNVAIESGGIALPNKVELAEAPAKVEPRQLIPDIDPWYAESLERFVTMLRKEAYAVAVEDKVKIFTDFLAAESQVRGIDYHRTPSVREEPLKPDPASTANQIAGNGQSKRISVEPVSSVAHMNMQGAEQYSPGGRPLVGNRSRPVSESVGTVGPAQDDHGAIIVSAEQASGPGIAGYKPYGHNVSSSDFSSASVVMTPASSTAGEPAKSPPLEPPSQSYKPYVPSDATTPTSPPKTAEQSQQPQPMQTNKREQEDIFFIEPLKPSPKATPSPSNGQKVPDLATIINQTAPKPAVNPVSALQALLPSKIQPLPPSEHLKQITDKAKLDFPPASDFIAKLTKEYDNGAAKRRATNEAARRKRQEESESRSEELYNNDEIGYGDISELEETFKKEESAKQMAEARDEYARYNAEVFDKVYNTLQTEIGELMEMFVVVEAGLTGDSASGKALLYRSSPTADSNAPSPPTTLESLTALHTLHDLIEQRHALVSSAVAERDRRYKRTEVSILYAAGTAAKLKSLERHFDTAERAALLKSREDALHRAQALLAICEDAVIRAVQADQDCRAEIVDALEAAAAEDAAGDGTRKADEELRTRARDALRALTDDSGKLMRGLSGIERALCAAEFDARKAREASQAQAGGGAGGAEGSSVEAIEAERRKEEEKLGAELRRRLAVLEEDLREAERLVGGAAPVVVPVVVPVVRVEGGTPTSPTGANEEEKERRMRAALEEAKRRNAVK